VTRGITKKKAFMGPEIEFVMQILYESSPITFSELAEELQLLQLEETYFL